MTARGVLHVHSCPPALCPHVTWAVARVLGAPIDLAWSQAATPGLLRAECEWDGAVGTASRLASALKGWQPLRFETVELASPGCDGWRYSYTGSLGLFATAISANGDVMIGEDHIRALLDAGGDLRSRLADLLGAPWDAELEGYRKAGYLAPVNRVAQVV
ncbi:MAG: DUF3145 family protein [Frankiaceae bacterium]